MSHKFQCVWKPAQSGKTRTVMEMIREHEELAAHLNIVVCSNIRLLVSQTTARMTRDLFRGPEEDDAASELSSASEGSVSDDHIEGNVFSWMSGTAATNVPVGELADRIKEDEVSMVICCSHKKRFRYLMDLLANLEKSKHFSKPINVWIDEADVSVKTWSDPEFDFARFKKVARVSLVSATFNSVIKRYGRIKVVGFDATHPDCYMPLNECKIVVNEVAADPKTNLINVLEANPKMCAKGVRLFAPAMVDVASHDDVLDYLKSKGFAVMVLNGQRKCIVCPDDTIIPLALRLDPTNPDEISQILPALYAKHKLSRWPFAVTGQLCLGRGITFQSAGFAFNYGVLPDLSDPATAYQCVARLLGNVKDFPRFKPPTVFMSQEMKDINLAQEKIAIHVAKKVLEKGWADVGADEIDYVLHGDEEKYVADTRKTKSHAETVSHLEEFKTMELLQARWKEIISETGQKFRSPNTPRKNADGEYTSSLGGKTEKQTASDVRAKFGGASTASWGSGLTDAEEGDFIARVYAGYEPKGRVVFFLRWTQKA